MLDELPTITAFRVRPFVGVIPENLALTPNPDEVASVHRIALDTIERDEAFDFTAIPESTRRVIRFHHQMSLIHAPTAALIYQFREVLAGRHTRVTDLEQPVFAWK